MRSVRWFFVLVVLLALGAGLAYFRAGRADGPAIAINQPSVIGQAGTLDVTIEAPGADLSALTIELAQKGRSFPILDLASAPEGSVVKEGERLRVKQPIGKSTIPDLASGPATVRVRASRPVLRGLRQVASEASRDVEVRLTPPRIAVVSTHHYINVGGSEMIVYRVSPPDVESGVLVGDVTYPGFPGSNAGLKDPELKVAFFALLYDQKPGTLLESSRATPPATRRARNSTTASFRRRSATAGFRWMTSFSAGSCRRFCRARRN